jgi:thioredoxin reductase (NADPH)
MKEYDAIIIGAGISGMTAAIYLKRFGFNTLILEKEYPGGQLTKISEIENYPGYLSISGIDLAEKIYNQVKQLEIPIKFEKVEDVINSDQKIIKATSNEYKAKYLVLATGRTPKKLNLPNEEELIGKGISYCATCDGPLYKGKEVIVVGGGDSALQEAIYLSKICKKVTLIHRRDTFRASLNLVNQIDTISNIETKMNTTIKEIKKTDTLTSVLVNEEGKVKELITEGLFIYIGTTTDLSYCNNLMLDQENGYIKVDETKATNIENIYAIGDLIKKDAYQLTTATGDATIAAIAIHKKEINQKAM